MQDVLNDYFNYCRNDGLITVSDAWRYMRMPLSGATFDFNVKNNIYYCNIDRGFRPHEYVGLYKNKSVRAIGKICAVITAERVDSEIEYKAEMGELTEERKDTVRIALEDKESHGWYDQCRYFIVEKFYDTDFKKITPKAPMGTRVFDLSQILELDELPDTKTIAEILKSKSWS